MIKLIAVTKQQPIEKIEWAIQQGMRAFGENYFQEAQIKIDYFKKQSIKNIVWHFIGRLQSNKTRKIAQYFDWVQSLDSKEKALKLHQARSLAAPPLNVCIQVSYARQKNLAGIPLNDLEKLQALIAYIASLPNLKWRGLMTIDTTHYEKTAQVFYALKSAGHDIDTLSMGMSQDYKKAVLAGSTMLRLGTAVFGQRK